MVDRDKVIATAHEFIRLGDPLSAMNVARLLNQGTKGAMERYFMDKTVKCPTKSNLIEFLSEQIAEQSAMEATLRKGDFSVLKGTGLDIVAIPNTIDVLVLPIGHLFSSLDIKVYIVREEDLGSAKEKAAQLVRKETEIIESVDSELMVGREAAKLFIEYHELEGDLLGFPQCCISDYVKTKLAVRNYIADNYGFSDGRAAATPEERAILQEVQRGTWRLLIENRNRLHELAKKGSAEFPRYFYSFVTLGFFPCSYDCRDALRLGIENEAAMPEDLALLYRSLLIGRSLGDMLKMFLNLKRRDGELNDGVLQQATDFLRTYPFHPPKARGELSKLAQMDKVALAMLIAKKAGFDIEPERELSSFQMDSIRIR